jgi:hypothetical protein
MKLRSTRKEQLDPEASSSSSSPQPVSEKFSSYVANVMKVFQVSRHASNIWCRQGTEITLCYGQSLPLLSVWEKFSYLNFSFNTMHHRWYADTKVYLQDWLIMVTVNLHAEDYQIVLNSMYLIPNQFGFRVMCTILKTCLENNVPFKV